MAAWRPFYVLTAKFILAWQLSVTIHDGFGFSSLHAYGARMLDLEEHS